MWGSCWTARAPDGLLPTLAQPGVATISAVLLVAWKVCAVRSFEVHRGVVPEWDGMTPAAHVVAEFLATVRLTGHAASARRLMADQITCHQVVSEAPQTLVRTPDEYAAHVQDMLGEFGRFRFHVTEFLTEADHVFVRWRQAGHVRAVNRGPGSPRAVDDVGSAVYRVHHGKIVEYWVQLDRLGLAAQLVQ